MLRAYGGLRYRFAIFRQKIRGSRWHTYIILGVPVFLITASVSAYYIVARTPATNKTPGHPISTSNKAPDKINSPSSSSKKTKPPATSKHGNAAAGPIAKLAPAGPVVSPTVFIADTRAGHRLYDNETGASGPPAVIPNLATAQAIAARSSALILSYGGQLNGFKSQMLAINPSLKFMRYMNPAFSRRSDLPSSWYYRDSEGRRLYDAQYGVGNWWLMNPDSTGSGTVALGEYSEYGTAAVSSFADYLVKTYLAQKQVDGNLYQSPWFDDVGGNPNSRNLNAEGAPGVDVNPITSEQGWYDLTTGLVSQVVNKVGGVRWGNALMSAQCYYPPGCGGALSMNWFYANNKLDASMAEAWLSKYSGGSYTFPTESEWQKNVQLVMDVDRPTQFHVYSGSNSNQWRKYAYASFLLGNRGKGLFNYASGDTWEAAQSIYGLDIGAPLADVNNPASLKRPQGHYRRDYQRGKVYVNPTGGIITVDGLTLPPNSGEILYTG